MRMKAPILDWLRSLLSKQKKPVAEVRPKFPAVEIDPGLNQCCEAVRNLRGQRYLMTNAPSIPVPGCDAKTCNCRYQRFTDRRHETRRGLDAGVASTLYSDSEVDKRLGNRGRRSTDQVQGGGKSH